MLHLRNNAASAPGGHEYAGTGGLSPLAKAGYDCFNTSGKKRQRNDAGVGRLLSRHLFGVMARCMTRRVVRMTLNASPGTWPGDGRREAEFGLSVPLQCAAATD
jgi:hypothetical protein